MNGKMVNGKMIYVNRAQKKKERQMELHRKYEAEKMERYNRFVWSTKSSSGHPFVSHPVTNLHHPTGSKE